MLRKEKTGVHVERRQKQRFRVREGALAFLGSVPGTITDISQSGMSVKYVVFEKEPEQKLKLDIFFPEGDFFLPGIPGHLVSDLVYPSEGPFSSVQVKRLGIRFGELSSEQNAGLQFFLLHNVVSEA